MSIAWLARTLARLLPPLRRSPLLASRLTPAPSVTVTRPRVAGPPAPSLSKAENPAATTKSGATCHPQLPAPSHSNLMHARTPTSPASRTLNPPVTDEQLEQAMQQLRERHAELRTVSGRAVHEHDFVIANYQGTFEGTDIPAIHGTNATLEVGAGQVLPEIEQGVVGMMEGEEKNIPITLPEDYRDDALAGRIIEIRLTVVELKEKVLPNLDDEFARAYEDADSLDFLQERLRSDVEAAIGERADAEVRADILKRLVDENTFEVPEVLVHDQMRRAYLQGIRAVKGGQLDEADFNVDVASMDETFSTQAREMVRGQLILRHIGAQAGITVTPEEVDAEIARLASRMAQNPEALKQTLQRNGTLVGIENGLQDDKIFASILADVQVSDSAAERATTTETSAVSPSEA